MTIKVVRERRNVAELMHWNRRDELKAVMQFIATCNIEEIAKIVEEIRCVHDCICVFDEQAKTLKEVKSIVINGESIQLNVEIWDEQEKA